MHTYTHTYTCNFAYAFSVDHKEIPADLETCIEVDTIENIPIQGIHIHIYIQLCACI